MSIHPVFLAAFAGMLSLTPIPSPPPGSSLVIMQVRIQATGQVSVTSWSQNGPPRLTSVLPLVVHCTGTAKFGGDNVGEFRCSNAVERHGLTLKTDINLAPIIKALNPSDRIQLYVDSPSMGFSSSSAPLENEGESTSAMQTGEFEASSAPSAIHLQFGYRPEQLAPLYLPFLGIAVALILLAAILSRAGLASLNLSGFLLGTTFWMGLAARLQAGLPLQILLFGNPLASAAALLFAFLPPLLCVALGAALGTRKDEGRKPARMFTDMLSAYGIFLLPLTCAAGSLPSISDGDWHGTIPWLVALPCTVLLCRWALRARFGSSLRRVASGELYDRVSQLASRAGWRKLTFYISFSTQSTQLNAFALPGRSIIFTAPLLQSLSRREVDAVAAHELGHLRHAASRPWSALGVAMVLFQTPVAGLLLPSTTGFIIAVLLPAVAYMVALHGVRRREFQADARAVALIGDPRPLIAALARISRNNKKPLEINSAVEWFSSHPSTLKRIRKMALGRLTEHELQNLITTDDPGEPYPLPQQESGPIFTLAWQRRNAGVYGWSVLFIAAFAGLAASWLLHQIGSGLAHAVAAIMLGCMLTKATASAIMSASYARLREKLSSRLGASGRIVGLAVDSDPRVYNGFRFSDAGLLQFRDGRLLYRSERATVALNPADVVEMGMVSASPSNWLRLQPMVRFRCPVSGNLNAFILHPLGWLPTQRRLLRSIQRWHSTSTSSEPTLVTGFEPVAGQPFTTPTLAGVGRAFLFSGGATLIAAMPACPLLQFDWWFALYALAATACAHLFMFLPAMLYRTSPLRSELAPSMDAN